MKTLSECLISKQKNDIDVSIAPKCCTIKSNNQYKLDIFLFLLDV